MTRPYPDVVGLYTEEAISSLKAFGINFVCKTAAPNESSLEQMRVIRQKHKDPGLIELVLAKHPITWKGGGNGGIQNY